MKGFTLLALVLALDASFVYSIASSPSREEAAARLAPAGRAAPQAAAADELPCFVSREAPILVRVSPN